MRKQRTSHVGMFLLAVAAVALLLAAPSTASRRASTLVIWATAAQAPALQASATAWGKSTVTVSVHDFASIRTDLKTVNPANAPDIVVGQNDWLADLVPSGLLLPLYPTPATKSQFPQYLLDGFSYGIALKKLYGAPYGFDNVALVVNTGLVKLPSTFAQLEREALAFRRRKTGNLAIAVPQATPNDAAYYTYPFFSGLGGYIFGKNKVSLLDPSDIGVANRTLLANSALIDRWNRERLIDSKVDYNTAKTAFLNKQAAFWITGPWESDALKASGFKVKIIQVPKLKLASVPFLAVQGLMVTKYAATHALDTLARDFVANYMMTPAAQLAFAKANARMPANTRAAKTFGVTIQYTVQSRFGKAGIGGVPVPNLPQMGSVWGDLGLAWIKSTQGVGATRARVAFKTAAHDIAEKTG